MKKNNGTDIHQTSQSNTVDEQATSQPSEAQTQITKLEQDATLYLAGWKRAQADYQNLKKETDKLRLETIQFANQALIETLIPILDNFALAIQHLPTELSENTWVQGILYIYKQFQDILTEEGVEIINPQGEIFNPHLHEAVDSSADQNGENIRVTEVLQVGYRLKGKLIRSARVKVSS